MVSGIYKITNLINNKIYIGSSKNIHRRKIEHYSDLRRNDHPNKYLQNSWNKYGEENFKFEIVEKCKVENLLIREQFYLDYYKSYNPKIGYNATFKSSGGYANGTKLVLQYDLVGNFVKEWESFASAANSLKLQASGISHASAGRSHKHGGFIWIVKLEFTEELLNKKIKLANKNKHFLDTIEKMKYRRSLRDDGIHVIQMTLDGEFIKEHISMNKAAKETGTNLEVLSGCCKGKYKTGNGFLWKAKKNNII